MTSEERRKEIRAIQKQHPWFYTLIVVAIALGFGVGIAASEFADDSRGFWMNLATEALGVVTSVVITVFVIDRIYERRNQMRRTEELKHRLVREAGSRSNDIAVAAIEQLREKGWLQGNNGLLRGATLSRADLSAAYLEGANMHGATLLRINLENANLEKANLRRATLYRVNLQYVMAWKSDFEEADFGLNSRLTGAAFGFANLEGSRLTYCWIDDTIMPGVNLKGAHLQHSNLNRSDLYDANLHGANLSGASLLGARLTSAKLDGANLTNAVLPDGTTYSGDTDTDRFTDSEHPEYKSTKVRVDQIRKSLKFDDQSFSSCPRAEKNPL